MAKHVIKANTLTAETDKISAVRKIQYTQVWGFDPLDLVTRQWVEEAIGGLNGFILNQDEDVQTADFRISGTGEASAFKLGAFTMNDDTVSVNHMLWSSGVYSYAGLSIASGTQFNIGAFNGFVVDNTVPNNPVITEVNYAGSTNNTTPFLLTNPATFVTADKFGVITLSPAEPTEAFLRANILLGAVAHPLGTITAVSSRTDVLMGAMDQVADMFRPIKYINEGVSAYPNGVNLALANTAGRLYGLGIGFVTNGKDTPNSLAVAAGAPTTFQYRTQTGVGGADTTLIVPGSYDVGGTVTPVGGAAGASTNQRVYLSETGVIRVQWGQQVYNTLAEAIAGSSNEPFTIFSNNRLFGILIAIISINKSCTNLADPATCRILSVSKFGEAVGGSAGIATGTLQTAYNNSLNPEIVTNGVNLALTIRRGSALDTDKIFEGQNGAGTVTSNLDGNGLFIANDIRGAFSIQSFASVTANTSFLVGTGAGTFGGDNNLIKTFAGSGFINIKGGSGVAKISIANDVLYLISGTTDGIIFNGNANSSTNTGTTFGKLFPSGNWSFANTPIDNGFKLEVVGLSRFAGNVTVGTDTQNNSLNINGQTASTKAIFYKTAGLNRWSVSASSIPESGSNNGTSFNIARYDDTGSFIENTITILRQNGFIGIGSNLVSQSRLQVDGRITITNPPSSEALRVISDTGFIAFWNTPNSVRSAYIQNDLGIGALKIEYEAGAPKFILLNPTSLGNIGIHTINPQAKLQIDDVNNPGAGEATWKGSIQLNHNPNVADHGGLEFKLDSSNNGYGKRILGVFNGAADYNLEFQSRTASAAWSTNFLIASGSDQSRVISLKNPALNSLLYTNSHFEARTDDGSTPSIGFNRAGFSAVALYHKLDSGDDILRIRTAGGNDYTIWHSGNLSPVAGSGTLDQVLTNGNVSDPSSRFAIIGRIAIGKSGVDYGVIGEGFTTTGTSNLYNYYDNNFATQIDFDSGNIDLKTAPSGTVGNPITFTSRLFIRNSDGFVGIGTTTTAFNLAGRKVVSINGSGFGSLLEFQDNGVFQGYVSGTTVGLEVVSATRVALGAGSALKLIITPAGDVGIGPNVTAPLSRLHVEGGRITVSGAGDENLRLINDGAFISFFNTANSLRSGYIQGSAAGSLILQSEQGNQYILLNQGGGNVGIGTNSPSEKLHVTGIALFDNRITSRESTNNSAIDLQSAEPLPNIQGLIFSRLSTKDLTFQKYGGNIGIGNITPSEKLDVAGNVKATEFIRTSSIANKSNVEDYTDSALDILLDTKIRTYNKIDSGDFGIGFIAEDTHEILSGEKRDVHNFGAHLALLTKAIQELKEKNDKLESEIKTLKGCHE